MVSLRNLLFFAILFGLALLSFALVRDNTFWHSGDFLLLGQAIDMSVAFDRLWDRAPFQPFQPLVKLVFYGEYLAFGLDAWKYYLFNIFLHSVNAYLVYYLVYTLLKDRTIALLSSILFVTAVGNYGKAVMVVSGISDLLITFLTLTTLLLYFVNELQKGGRMNSRWYWGAAVFFLLSLTTKATSFSILGCIMAFLFFFKNETGKPVFNRNFVLFILIAVAAFVVKFAVFRDDSAWRDFDVGFNVFRNMGSYLVRMVFPIHGSSLVTDSGVAVKGVYTFATQIRMVTFLTIISYSVFGFIFGNRTVRFFIAWTYITLLPFCFFYFPEDWLNIRYLYLVSIGFIMILASVTVLASRLLYERQWRRFLPYGLPLLFVFLSQFIIFHLDKNYERTAASAAIENMQEELRAKYDSVDQ